MNPITDTDEQEANGELTGTGVVNNDNGVNAADDDNHIVVDDLSSARVLIQEDETLDVENHSHTTINNTDRRGMHASHKEEERMTHQQEATEGEDASKEPIVVENNTRPTNKIQQQTIGDTVEKTDNLQPTLSLQQQESTDADEQIAVTCNGETMSNDATNRNEIQNATMNDESISNYPSMLAPSLVDQDDELITVDDVNGEPTTFGQEEEKQEMDLIHTGNRVTPNNPLQVLQQVETPVERISDCQHQQQCCIPMAAAVLLPSPQSSLEPEIPSSTTIIHQSSLCATSLQPPTESLTTFHQPQAQPLPPVISSEIEMTRSAQPTNNSDALLVEGAVLTRVMAVQMDEQLLVIPNDLAIVPYMTDHNNNNNTDRQPKRCGCHCGDRSTNRYCCGSCCGALTLIIVIYILMEAFRTGNLVTDFGDPDTNFTYASLNYNWTIQETGVVNVSKSLTQPGTTLTIKSFMDCDEYCWHQFQQSDTPLTALVYLENLTTLGGIVPLFNCYCLDTVDECLLQRNSGPLFLNVREGIVASTYPPPPLCSEDGEDDLTNSTATGSTTNRRR